MMLRNAIYRYLLGRVKQKKPLDQMQLNGCKFTVSVEGNIASGKSTFLKFFDKFPSVQGHEEPVDQWTKIGGKHNALKLLYEDPVRWSFAFNNYASLTRLQIHMKPTKHPVKMIERSLFTTRYIFTECAYKSKWLTDLEYMILNEYFEVINSLVQPKVDLFVYLRASPEVCFQRLLKRSRHEENTVSKEYLKDLHNLHEDLFIDMKKSLPAPVLVIDGNSDMSAMYRVYEEKKSTILGGNV